MADTTANRLATNFIASYERAWWQGADAAAELYTADGVLVGFTTALGRDEIRKTLRSIMDQGWTQIKMRVVDARRVGGVVAMANEYTAIGSGAMEGKTRDATSSHVLVEVDGEWLSTLHTAR